MVAQVGEGLCWPETTGRRVKSRFCLDLAEEWGFLQTGAASSTSAWTSIVASSGFAPSAMYTSADAGAIPEDRRDPPRKGYA